MLRDGFLRIAVFRPILLDLDSVDFLLLLIQKIYMYKINSSISPMSIPRRKPTVWDVMGIVVLIINRTLGIGGTFAMRDSIATAAGRISPVC
jgi:hypothetical protein